MTSSSGAGPRQAARLGLVLLTLAAVAAIDLTVRPPDGVAQAAYLLPVLVAGVVAGRGVLLATAAAAVLAHAVALAVTGASAPVPRGLVLAGVAAALVVVLERRSAPDGARPVVVQAAAPVTGAARRGPHDGAQRELVRAADVSELARLVPLADPADEGLGTGLLLAQLDLLTEHVEVHGAAAGEAAVAHVATVLRAAVRPGDTVARLGSSTLVVLMPGVGREAVNPRGEALRRVVRDSPLPWEGAELQVTIGVGAAHTSDGHRDTAALHTAAQDALHRAQADGRDRLVWP